MKLSKLLVASLAAFSIASGGSALAQQPAAPKPAAAQGADHAALTPGPR